MRASFRAIGTHVECRFVAGCGMKLQEISLYELPDGTIIDEIQDKPVDYTLGFRFSQRLVRKTNETLIDCARRGLKARRRMEKDFVRRLFSSKEGW